jgi:hypothetical protein
MASARSATSVPPAFTIWSLRESDPSVSLQPPCPRVHLHENLSHRQSSCRDHAFCDRDRTGPGIVRTLERMSRHLGLGCIYGSVHPVSYPWINSWKQRFEDIIVCSPHVVQRTRTLDVIIVSFRKLCARSISRVIELRESMREKNFQR